MDSEIFAPGHWCDDPPIRDWGAAFMKYIQKSLAKATGPNHQRAADKVFEKGTPALCEFLTCNEDAGRARQTATLLVFCDSGLFKAFLTDRETNRQLAASAGTFAGLLEALEHRITSDDPEWRIRPAWEPAKGKSRRA
jgi:hypothetical protein